MAAPQGWRVSRTANISLRRDTYLINGRYSVTRGGVVLSPRTKQSLYHNGYLKIYPDGSRVLLTAERNIFRESGWEERGKARAKPEPEPEPDAPGQDEVEALAAEGEGSSPDLSRSRRRARSAIADLAYSNDFKYFVTFTLDSTKVNRYDVVEITRKLNNWLDNNVRRKGLKYVLVPELHKDGAVHFHGLINDALELRDSGTFAVGAGKPRKPRSKAERRRWLKSGSHHQVWNVEAWTLGFSTAIELYGSREQAIAYVCKYISKSDGKVGGRWYYSGGQLRRPQLAAISLDFAAASARAGKCFTLDGLGMKCCRVFFKNSEEYENAREDLGIARGAFNAF